MGYSWREERFDGSTSLPTKARSSASRLVEPAAADVAHPLDHIVVRIVQLRLEHLEVSNFEARRRERDLRIWSITLAFLKTFCFRFVCYFFTYFKVHRDRRSRPFLLGVRLQKFNFRRKLRLFHSAHALDSSQSGRRKTTVNKATRLEWVASLLPNDGILGCFILCLAFHAEQLNPGSVEGRGNAYFNLLRQQGRLEVRFHNHLHFHLRSAYFAYERDHSERQRNVLGRSIPNSILISSDFFFKQD